MNRKEKVEENNANISCQILCANGHDNTLGDSGTVNIFKQENYNAKFSNSNCCFAQNRKYLHGIDTC